MVVRWGRWGLQRPCGPAGVADPAALSTRRERAADAAERAAALQAELDGRRAAERKQAHEAMLAQRRADEGDERLQALQAKQVEGLKASHRMASELQQERLQPYVTEAAALGGRVCNPM